MATTKRGFDFTVLLVSLPLLLIMLLLPGAVAEEKNEAAPAGQANQDVKALIAQLESDDVALKTEAIGRLKEMKETSAIESLARTLGDSNDAVRWESKEALAAIGAPAIDALIGALGSENQEARWKAGNALEDIGEEAVPTLMEALKSDNATRRREAAFILGRLKDNRSVTALAAALHDKDEDARWKAAIALKNIGPPAVEALIAELEGPNVFARQCAAWIFQELKDKRTAAPLVAALADKDKDVRDKAAIALKDFGPLAKDALANALRNGAPGAKETAYLCLRDSSDLEIQKALYQFKKEKKDKGEFDSCRPLKNISSKQPPQWQYTFMPGKGAPRYDLTLLIKTPDRDWNDDEARVVFDYQDGANFYCLRLVEKGLLLEKRLEGKTILPCGRVREKITGGAEVLIKRRVGRIDLFLNGRRVASVWDSAFSGGAVGLAATSNEFRFGRAKRQEIDDIYFADDFMQSDLASGVWASVGGDWSLDSVNSPSRSANAFRLVGKTASSAFWMTGYEFWDNYSFKAAVQPRDDAAVGLCFYYSDIGNHYLLRWSGNSSHPINGEDAVVSAQLIRIRDGEETIIAQRSGGHSIDQWYELAVTVLDGRITATIDDDMIYDGYDEYLVGGKVGLYTESQAGTLFDDVVVQSVHGLNDDFSVGTSKWNEIRGSWRLGKMRIRRSSKLTLRRFETFARSGRGEKSQNSPTRSLSQVYIVRTKDEAISISGNPEWRNYEVSADIRSTHGEIGVIFAYRDEENYGLFRWVRDASGGGNRQLLKTVNGEETLLAVDYEGRKLRRWYNLSAILEDNLIRIRVDGEQIFSAFDSDLSKGAVGLYAKDAIRASFDNVQVRLLTPPKPLPMASKVFGSQRKMESWATNYSNWKRKRSVVLGSEALVSWHKGYFFNDVTAEAQLRRFYPQGGRAGLLLSESANDVDSGYHFQVELKNKDDAKVRLFFKGDKISELQMDAESALALIQPESNTWRMKIERRWGFILCSVNDDVVILHREGAPLRAGKIGVYANGVTFSSTKKIKIYSDDVFDYMFEESPVDWHVQAGYWRVTNRWICDPTWSWLGGTSEQVAAFWNKRRFAGDMIMEFYAALKMDMPQPPHYHRRGDINAVICGDGENLDSGYAFIFGGWDNEWTRILRKGKIVAETKSHSMPKYRGTHHDIHWRWWHIRIEKTGATIRYFIDGNLALEYTDPDPLSGGYPCVWTYNNGVILARFRIYHKQGAMRRSPFTFTETVGFKKSGNPFNRSRPIARSSSKLSSRDKKSSFPLFDDFETDLGSWANCDGAQGASLQRDPETSIAGKYSLKLTNLNGGGSFAARCVSETYNATKFPILRLDYKIPPDVKVDLYFKIDTRVYAVLLTGPGEFSFPIKTIGKVDSIIADDKWRHAEFDLLAMLKNAGVSRPRLYIKEVVIGNYSNKDYLLCGFGGNRRGAAYHIDNFSIAAE